MPKYVGTISITVETDNEGVLHQLEGAVVAAASRLEVNRTATRTDIVKIEDYDVLEALG